MCIFVTILTARVDVEAPEFESESFRVMVFRNLDIQVYYIMKYSSVNNLENTDQESGFCNPRLD